MSVYGTIKRNQPKSMSRLGPQTYTLPDPLASLMVFQFQDVMSPSCLALQDSDLLEPLRIHLSLLFDAIVAKGRTYPQEEQLGLEGFKNYFL